MRILLSGQTKQKWDIEFHSWTLVQKQKLLLCGGDGMGQAILMFFFLLGTKAFYNCNEIDESQIIWKTFAYIEIATLSPILEFQLSWRSNKAQLARWGHEVSIFPYTTTHTPDQMA